MQWWIVDLSSCEAEYVAACDVAEEVEVIDDLNFEVQLPVKMFEDS